MTKQTYDVLLVIKMKNPGNIWHGLEVLGIMQANIELSLAQEKVRLSVQDYPSQWAAEDFIITPHAYDMPLGPWLPGQPFSTGTVELAEGEDAF